MILNTILKSFFFKVIKTLHCKDLDIKLTGNKHVNDQDIVGMDTIDISDRIKNFVEV